MPQEPTQDHQALAQTVKASLRKAEKIVFGLRHTHTRLLIAGIVSSAATTLVAGITAAQGPIVGDGTEGWRIACIVAAIFAFASTVCIGLNQQLKISDRLLTGTQCVGRLKSLDVGISISSRAWEEVTKEYEEIAKTYPELIS